MTNMTFLQGMALLKGLRIDARPLGMSKEVATECVGEMFKADEDGKVTLRDRLIEAGAIDKARADKPAPKSAVGTDVKADKRKVIGEYDISPNVEKKIAKDSADRDFKRLYDRAVEAGKAAAEAVTVTPMVIEQHENMLDDDSAVTQSWRVDGGVCGFAWINVKPGTSKVARWLKKNELARKDDYYGGVTIWVHNYGQSMTRKEAYAQAFATEFNKGTEDKIAVRGMSRMD